MNPNIMKAKLTRRFVKKNGAFSCEKQNHQSTHMTVAVQILNTMPAYSIPYCNSSYLELSRAVGNFAVKQL